MPDVPRCTAARDLLLALCYPAGGRCDSEHLASNAVVPSEPAALAVLRQSDWRFPEIDGNTVSFVNTEGSAVARFAFDASGQIERVSVHDSDPQVDV